MATFLSTKHARNLYVLLGLSESEPLGGNVALMPFLVDHLKLLTYEEVCELTGLMPSDGKIICEAGTYIAGICTEEGWILPGQKGLKTPEEQTVDYLREQKEQEEAQEAERQAYCLEHPEECQE